MNLYLMRHPAVLAAGRCLGQTDISLSEEGTNSVDRLIERVGGVAPGLLISSDLRRCRDFAEAAARRLECPLQVDARWREIDFGAWENRWWDEIRQADEIGFERWSSDFERMAPPGGESFQDLRRRIGGALEDLPRDRAAVVVTHAGCIRAAACLLEIVSPGRMFDWEVPYGALFSLDLEQRQLSRDAGRGKPVAIGAG